MARLAILALIALLSGCAGNVRPADGIDTVLVVGSTGETGRLIVAGLLREGYRVRAFTRDASKAGRLLGNQVDIATGDVKDTASVAKAMRDVDAVVSAIGARGATGPDRPEKVDYEGVKHLADAAAAEHIRHFVLISSMGVTREDNPLNRMFGNVLIWKARGEQAVRDSGVPYTIVRPGGLVNEPGGRGRIVAVQGDPEIGRVYIPRADLATVCIEALKHPGSRFRTLEVYRVEGKPVSDWKAFFERLHRD